MTGQDLLHEFDLEMAKTRSALERLTDDDLAFRPHERSWTALELAAHLAGMPTWCAMTFDAPEFDMASADAPPPAPQSVAEVLTRFDDTLGPCRESIAKATTEDLVTTWRFRDGDNVIIEAPRVGVYRSMIMNHMIHHRGQLVVYLRMRDRPVPALYGPSADEE